jgi:hypothetical protein
MKEDALSDSRKRKKYFFSGPYLSQTDGAAGLEKV